MLQAHSGPYSEKSCMVEWKQLCSNLPQRESHVWQLGPEDEPGGLAKYRVVAQIKLLCGANGILLLLRDKLCNLVNSPGQLCWGLTAPTQPLLPANWNRGGQQALGLPNPSRAPCTPIIDWDRSLCLDNCLEKASALIIRASQEANVASERNHVGLGFY